MLLCWLSYRTSRLRTMRSGSLRRTADSRLQTLKGFRRRSSRRAGTRSNKGACIILDVEIAVCLNLSRLRAVSRRRLFTLDRLVFFVTKKRGFGFGLTILHRSGCAWLFAMHLLRRCRSVLRSGSLLLDRSFANRRRLRSRALLDRSRCNGKYGVQSGDQ